MKKIIIVLTALLMILPLFSCEKDLVNNADTGEIIIAENKYTYTDGTYYASYDYFDSDGYCPAMMMKINGGVIRNVRFDYFTKDNTPLSENTDESYSEKAASLRSLRKSLYTQTLASQSLTGITYSQSDKFSVDYLSLAREILTSAGKDGENVIILRSVNAYSAEYPLDEGIFAKLTVTFVSKDISSIVFSITDENGNAITLDDERCLQLFGSDYGQTAKAISVLEENRDPDVLKKENTEESTELIFDVYNFLADEITSGRIKTDFRFGKLF